MFSKLLADELKKIVIQREIYIGIFICTFMYVLGLDQLRDNHNSTYWKYVLDGIPYIGNWFIAITVIIGTARSLPFEREQRMDELIRTYQFGRTKLLIVKLLAQFLFCTVIVLYYFLVPAVMMVFYYDISSIFQTLEASKSSYLYTFNNQWQVWRAFAVEYSFLLLGSYLLSLCIMLFSQFIRRSVFIMLIGGGIFAFTELLKRFILVSSGNYQADFPFQSFVNYFAENSINNLLNFTLFSFYKMESLLLFIMLAIVIIFSFILVVGKVRKHA